VNLLVLGGDGMLGHQLLHEWQERHRVAATFHQPIAAYDGVLDLTRVRAFGGVEARDVAAFVAIVREVKPDAVINGIGIVKQRAEAKAAIPSIEINALLPHRLAEVCQEHGARFVHISTDCVFSGRAGNYRETDVPDPVDLYGRSKLLGEVGYAPGLTLRTSIIGLELSRCTGLVEWFLAACGTIRGFRRAIYSGFTTHAMAALIEHVLTSRPDLSGLWHVASAPITKYNLLTQLAAALGRTDVDIVPDDDFACDRSLSADAFAREVGYPAPAWRDMIAGLADEIRARDRRRAGA
jgi:dTDP-4-dehydrorhamnose reductase